MYLLKNREQKYLIKVKDLITEETNYTWLRETQLRQMLSYRNREFSLIKKHTKEQLIDFIKKNAWKIQFNQEETYSIMKRSHLKEKAVKTFQLIRR